MKLDTRSIVEIVGVLAVVVSLAFVGYELRLSRQAALTDASGESAGNNLALLALLSDHPEVWRMGCLGEELDLEEQAVFSHLVRAVNSQYFQAWRRATIGISTGESDRWPLLVAINVHQYPGFGKKWRALESTSPTALSVVEADGENIWTREVNRQLATISQLPVKTSSDEFLCGV